MITVRPEMNKDTADLQNVIDSAVATLRQTYRPTQRAIDNKTQKTLNCQRLVATIEDQVVGSVQYFLDPPCVGVIGLDVHTDYRKKGVARSLISRIKEIGMSKKAIGIKLHTIKETGNIRIFKRLGFKVVSERIDGLFESDRFDTLTDVEMVMALTVNKPVDQVTGRRNSGDTKQKYLQLSKVPRITCRPVDLGGA